MASSHLSHLFINKKRLVSNNLALLNFGIWKKFNEENIKAHMLGRVG